MTVRFFSKSETHREFSNFAPFPIDLDEMCRPTVEHYYQAQKFADTELQQKIHKMPKPAAVKAIADKCRAKARPDWSEAKDVAMERAVRRKFDLYPELRTLLLATGDEELAEAAPTDCYWGVGREGTGENRLGKLLMRIRAS